MSCVCACTLRTYNIHITICWGCLDILLFGFAPIVNAKWGVNCPHLGINFIITACIWFPIVQRTLDLYTRSIFAILTVFAVFTTYLRPCVIIHIVALNVCCFVFGYTNKSGVGIGCVGHAAMGNNWVGWGILNPCVISSAVCSVRTLCTRYANCRCVIIAVGQNNM